MKKCPYCAEEIQDDAIVCRYCGRDLVKKKRRWWLWLLLFIAGLIWFAVCSITIGVMRDGYLWDYPVFPGIAGVSIATEVKNEVLPTKTDVPNVLPVTQTPLPTPLPTLLPTSTYTPQEQRDKEIENYLFGTGTGMDPDSFEACMEHGVMSYAVTSDGENYVEIRWINDKGRWQRAYSYLPWCVSYDTWTGRMYLYAMDNFPPNYYPKIDDKAPYDCNIYYHGKNVARVNSYTTNSSATCIYDN